MDCLTLMLLLLAERGELENYERNLCDPECNGLADGRDGVCDVYPIASAFKWSLTPEGYSHWMALDDYTWDECDRYKETV